MGCYVLDLREIDRTQAAVAGGKGAHLGELLRLEGIRVPPGFCVTTDAFTRALAGAPAIGSRLERLARVEPGDADAIRAAAAEMRRAFEAIALPEDVASAITGALAKFGEDGAYAVRSSATAEDLPSASFAGQHDTYLNVVGREAVLQHVSRCWASLFTERAITYRRQNGLDHRVVRMAVVVQQMVYPHAAGVLFTADPVSSNRKVASVEAGFGLGEGLVSGLVNADVYKVRDGVVIDKVIAPKRRAIHASPAGGTESAAVASEQQERPALTDTQVVQLVALGRRIEAHFGRPQDIEWCLAGGEFQIVQSRPITTLFPIPVAADQENHVYVSVGHQQMMTDAMKPLGISLWQLTALRPMHTAGGRLFVDVARDLASPAGRARLLDGIVKADPLTGDALRTILERRDFIPAVTDGDPAGPLAAVPPDPPQADPAIPAALIERSQASIATLKREIQTKSGSGLLEFILADIQELRRILSDPESLRVIMAGMAASRWLGDRLEEWLGETNAADALTQAVPHNVTSEMGLALLDVADVIRPHPDVVDFLEHVEDEDFLDELAGLPGGREARDSIQAYLDKYGMRCVGEIDITRPRWSERPTALVPLILGNIRNNEPGAARRRVEQGRQAASRTEQEVLTRLRALPDGERKAEEAKRMIDRVRTFAGYREYPKYGMVSRYFVYKQALLQEAARLVSAGVLAEREDIYYLTFQELHDVVRTNVVDDELVRRRKAEFRSYRALTPPRVFTSDGEVIAGAYRRSDVPGGALVGLGVSAGIVEGRARVILDISAAQLGTGDILVTAYTDPSWTPVFVAVKALVTEVGGLMTHGAVIAREYGLPAVVGVEHATELIRDGQRIRVHGAAGYIELLS